MNRKVLFPHSNPDPSPARLRLRGPRRRWIVLAVMLAALFIGIPIQLELPRTQQRIAMTKAEAARLDRELARAAQALEALRTQHEEGIKERERIRTALAQTKLALAKQEPDYVWAEPPPAWPEWNSESPYIWMRKEMLPRYGISAFTGEGLLSAGAAAVLAISGEQQQKLNDALPRLLQEYRDLEIEKAELSDEHLPGISGPGPKATLRIQRSPAEGAQLKAQFENLLKTELGEQRADLVMKSSRGWIDRQFGQFGQAEKTISLIQHPDGSFNLSIDTGSGQMSMGGRFELGDHVPRHLLPLIAQSMKKQGASDF